MKKDPRFDKYNSYIMAAYIDHILAAGARVVPLILNEDEDVTMKKLDSLNGVLFPGGDGGYYSYGEFVFNYALEKNKNGTYFPIWGTCLGYEYIMEYTATAGKGVIGSYNYPNGSLPIEFVTDPRDT